MELHRHGNEKAWWTNLQIAPMETARELWAATLLQTNQEAGVAARQPGRAVKLDSASSAETGISTTNTFGR
jgi:hypothetical protein